MKPVECNHYLSAKIFRVHLSLPHEYISLKSVFKTERIFEIMMAAQTCKKCQWISPTSVLKYVSLKPKGTNNVLFQNPPASPSKHLIDFPFFLLFAAASLILTVYS